VLAADAVDDAERVERFDQIAVAVRLPLGLPGDSQATSERA